MTRIDGDGKHESPDDVAHYFHREFSKNFSADVSNSAILQQQLINVNRSIRLEMINIDEFSFGRVMQ